MEERLSNGGVVEAYFGAFERGGFDAIRSDLRLMDRIHPEIEWCDAAMLVDGVVLRGIDTIEHHFRDVLSWLDNPSFTVEDLHETRDRVVAEVRIAAGSGTASGAPFEGRRYFVWTFRDGIVVRAEGFHERDEAFAAAATS